MKFKRRYLDGGYNGKAHEHDFVTGYLAENGMYIDNEFGFGSDRPVGYKVYLSFDHWRADKFNKFGVECYRLKAAKEYCEKYAETHAT